MIWNHILILWLSWYVKQLFVVNKPNPKIYEVVLEKVGCEAHEVLFVGDTLLADVSGPRSQGMSARLIDRKNGQNLHDLLADLF